MLTVADLADVAVVQHAGECRLEGPVRLLRARPRSVWCRVSIPHGGARRGDGCGQSAPVSEMAMRAVFSSTMELFRVNAEVSALTARLSIDRG